MNFFTIYGIILWILIWGSIMEYKISENVKSVKPSAIREIFKYMSVPRLISFAAGNPSPESFPAEDMRTVADGIFATQASSALQYGSTEGYAPLRNQIKDRLKNKFNSFSENDELIITTGGQQGIDLCARAMLDPGDVVICESPTFIGALNAFRVCGARTVGVELEDDGISIDGLEKALKENPKAKILYLIPTFQNPSGITTVQEKRKKVYKLAKKYGVIVLEDNPYGELRFSGKDVPTVKSLDTEGIVMYCSSFSKILSSGMRVGFLCGPKELIDRCVVIKQASDVHTNLFFQMLVSGYLEKYDLDAHIQTIRELYFKKSSLMISALENGLDPSIRFTRPEGGLFVWVTLPKGDSTDIFKTCIDKKIAVVDGKTFLPSPAPCSSVRLNYSTPTDQQISDGISIFCETVNDYIKR